MKTLEEQFEETQAELKALQQLQAMSRKERRKVVRKVNKQLRKGKQ